MHKNTWLCLILVSALLCGLCYSWVLGCMGHASESWLQSHPGLFQISDVNREFRFARRQSAENTIQQFVATGDHSGMRHALWHDSSGGGGKWVVALGPNLRMTPGHQSGVVVSTPRLPAMQPILGQASSSSSSSITNAPGPTRVFFGGPFNPVHYRVPADTVIPRALPLPRGAGWLS